MIALANSVFNSLTSFAVLKDPSANENAQPGSSGVVPQKSLWNRDMPSEYGQRRYVPTSWQGRC